MSIRRAMFYYLPKEDGKEQRESDFWDLLQLREIQKTAADSQNPKLGTTKQHNG